MSGNSGDTIGGKWGVGSGVWGVGSGEWGVGSGKISGRVEEEGGAGGYCKDWKSIDSLLFVFHPPPLSLLQT